MKIRTAVPGDLLAITDLFSATIRTINVKDYSQAEIEAWASCAQYENSWKKRLEKQQFYVMESAGEVVGFSSLAKHGYLDFLFVHKDHQRKGIAQKLVREIEMAALEQSNREVYAFVSKTAESFFARQGFEKCGIRVSYLDGIKFESAVMRKEFGSSI